MTLPFSAAYQVMDFTPAPATGAPESADAPFSAWLSDSGHLMDAAVTEDKMRDLLPQVPQTPAGLAWAAAAQQALDLALADAWRPFDRGALDTDAEKAAAADLDALADALEARSPLLTDVADELRHQTLLGYGPGATFDLGDTARTSITNPRGVILGTPDECDKHDGCYPGSAHARLVSWADIDLFAPGTRETVLAIVARLNADLPDLADDDGGANRGHLESRTAA